LDLLVVVS